VLKIRDTTDPAQPAQSLGIQPVSGFTTNRAPSHQTLIFRIPNTLKTHKFDELVVSFYLKGARADQSARIAIDRFRLVPLAG